MPKLRALIYGIIIKHLAAVEASLIQTLEPILNQIWVVFFFGKIHSPFTLVSGAFVVFAVRTRAKLVRTQSKVHKNVSLSVT